MASCLEVTKPRLGAHADRDPRAKQGDLLLYIYHKSLRAPPPHGHDGPIWEVGDVHVHVNARAEIVCPNILRGKAKWHIPHSLALRPGDGDDGGGADGEETLRGGVVADRGVWITALFPKSKEYIDAKSDRSGF